MMIHKRTLYLVIIFLIIVFLFASGTVTAAPASLSTASPSTTPTPRIATEEELQLAYAEWSVSKHADTYDDGLGANTTCAKCKSPVNWNPGNKAQEQALDCYSCKRIPGEPRPDLSGSELVNQADWVSISCGICHQPAGNSYKVSISFWDQTSHTYLPVENVTELCSKCHEGSHGFEVIEEQEVSPAHSGWECTKCHGAHGAPSKCTDCHDPKTGPGAAEHARHPSVNCTACHDQGKLNIWQDENPLSKHYSQYITIRFGHALRSWPSHNLSRVVECKRCHHPGNREQPVTAQEVSCEACHPDGGVLFWCKFLKRDGNPNAVPIDTP